MKFSQNIQFQTNFLVNSLKYGMYLKGNVDLTITNNNIMKVRERSWVQNEHEYDLVIGIFYDNVHSLESKNIFIANNIVSSVKWFAFAIVGHAC